MTHKGALGLVDGDLLLGHVAGADADGLAERAVGTARGRDDALAFLGDGEEAPLVAAAVAVTAGTVATTGRLMRWLPESSPRRALVATTAVAALAGIGDLLVIAVYLRSAMPIGPFAVLAVTASLTRVGCSVLVARRSLTLARRLR